MFIPHGRTDKTRLGGLTDKVSSSPRAGFGAPLLRLLSENPEITFEESMPQGESAGRSFRTRRGRPCRRHTALPKIGCVFIEVGGARGGGGRAGGGDPRTYRREACAVRRAPAPFPPASGSLAPPRRRGFRSAEMSSPEMAPEDHGRMQPASYQERQRSISAKSGQLDDSFGSPQLWQRSPGGEERRARAAAAHLRRGARPPASAVEICVHG